jgi:hypothetical protein
VLDATKKMDRRRAAELRVLLFATDDEGNQDALALRMGVMYVIWDDRMWFAWNGFTKSRISLSRAGGRGATSWYDGRLPTVA